MHRFVPTRRSFIAHGLGSLAPTAAGPAFATSESGAAVRLEAAAGRWPLGSRDVVVHQFGGSVPGSVIRTKAGEEVRARLLNRLDAPLSLHWQGVRIVNGMDGAAGLTQPPVPPGGGFDIRFAPPDSGTFLYRPCVPGSALPAAADGLHGLLIVEERTPLPVDHEFPLVAAEWRPEPAASPLLAVNGRAEGAKAALPRGARVRLRIANAAPAALLLLAIDGAKPSVVAVDSQPCEPFVPGRGVIPVGPGARFDLVLDLPDKAGALVRVTLRHALDRSVPAVSALELTTTQSSAPSRAGPAALPQNPKLPAAIALERAARAELTLKVPAREMPARRTAPTRAVLTPELKREPILSAERGRPVVFALVNPSPQPMSVHVHGHAMRVLHDLDDGWHPYWRDTVLIEPRKTHHAAFVADNPGKWLVEAVTLGAGSSPPRCGWYEVR